ncbi:uncharacterized protein N7484_003608 [Penicillium longicatenatum]|uniref:uncharacterized protein n=1 Tax=Penicillium longicatenatum TaxID=1561947 RepID=UPI002547BA1A|nr:uncharacterized protein N7484_003608 [Penicillium longicatenatum]KAJ5649885.1 hypothetical protein N7484_003608 [Penicillium longicatenatum]
MAHVSYSQLEEPIAHSPSHPSPTSSSDKENPRHSNKKSTAQMPSASTSKRRRLTDRTSNTQSQMDSSRRNNSTKYYDPDQDPEERRRNRKGFRDLQHDVHTSRAEFMRTGNDGIKKTLEKANELYAGVKQTSDATLDSRLLVNVADLSHKKTAQIALGDNTAGIDVDEFVSKCISYMRRGPELSTLTPNAGTRRRRHAATQRDPDDSDEADEGDAMNWDWLGRTACLPCNSRPTVSGWLLGPLSVQKKTRQLTQRTQTERFDPTQLTKPNELVQDDLSGQENANLTTICQNINTLLGKIQIEGQEAVDTKLSEMEDEPKEETKQKMMADHNVADDGGVPLFRFCINPHSFGQSVENLFYVSFLVRDGSVGVSSDSRELPTLHTSRPYQPSDAQARGIQKRQAIFSLDFETWEQLVDVFNITESIIPHRNESADEAATTWYGGR